MARVITAVLQTQSLATKLSFRYSEEHRGPLFTLQRNAALKKDVPLLGGPYQTFS